MNMLSFLHDEDYKRKQSCKGHEVPLQATLKVQAPEHVGSDVFVPTTHGNIMNKVHEMQDVKACNGQMELIYAFGKVCKQLSQFDVPSLIDTLNTTEDIVAEAKLRDAFDDILTYHAMRYVLYDLAMPTVFV